MRAVVLVLLCSSTSAFIPSAVVKKLSNSRIQSTEEAAAAEEPVAEAAAPEPAAPAPASMSAPAADGYTVAMQEKAAEKETRILALPGMSTKSDLVTLAAELCPAVPFWDPLGLADQGFWCGVSPRRAPRARCAAPARPRRRNAARLAVGSSPPRRRAVCHARAGTSPTRRPSDSSGRLKSSTDGSRWRGLLVSWCTLRAGTGRPR